ncbi:hypothetical protein Ae201684P_009981 [Aphanomyces euteiches]|uniref:Protein kinase domain-containing protein n=1 Tax=Aphanomyces euteiches TaxID=100861 RepID=A0A6G0W8E3_9STRA|nr:hypothetical protein Ae201684_018408 [Aphanomyces euteiches]KAH9051535.1 hypothetical protein Ae201684P_021991 [Aphanomyces euteiches]KAH9079744.1 hypothetical protein Ae201684P_009618 [Aphanomyces euteiches]KAH9087767.1 hypothetical protein Ae201684P_009981 [Aphanomyces euteiches]
MKQVLAAIVAAAVASTGAAQKTCPYSSLPPLVVNITVAGNCTLGMCVVDRNCTLINDPSGSAPYQAVGDYLTFSNTSLAYRAFDSIASLNVAYARIPDTVHTLAFLYWREILFPANFSWHNNVTRLFYQGTALKNLPPVPPTTTALHLIQNAFADNEDLRSLPTTIKELELSESNYTEFNDIDWSNMENLRIFGIKRIANVKLSLQLKYFAIRDSKVGNWTLDSNTFAALNTANYSVYNVTADASKSYCEGKNGELRTLWPNRSLNNATGNVTNLTVCVTSDSANSTPAFPSSSNNLGLIVGLSIGGAVLVCAIAAFFLRRRQAQAKKELEYMQQMYDATQTPTLQTAKKTELTLVKKLGSGAFADVWLGTFQEENVAVKKMHASKITPNQLQSFVDEIQLMSTFDSPWIVRLVGAAWTRPSNIKCVMELMDSGDLKDYLDTHDASKFPWVEKYVHMLSIVEGLAYLHSMNIIHRDLKSRNVLMDSTKGTKLTDFGISKEDIQATMTMGVGTFRWMAPEVVQDQEYNVSADIYSFGMVLSEFDTHRIPYENLKNPANGMPIADSAIMVKVVGGTIKPAFTPDCPPWVLELAMQCLAYNPADRPTALQVASTIRLKLKELSISGEFSLGTE